MQTITLLDADATVIGELGQGSALAEYVGQIGGIYSGGLLQVDPRATNLGVDPIEIRVGRFVEVTDANKTTVFYIASRPEQPYMSVGTTFPGFRSYELVSGWGYLSRATINPTKGMSGRSPEYVPFGPARYAFDPDADPVYNWVGVVTSGTKASPSFDRDGEQYPDGWTGPGDVNYIHGVSTGGTVAEGLTVLRKTFTLAERTTVEIELTVDDELIDFWFAEHQPFSNITGRNQWQKTFEATVEGVDAGSHAVYAVVNNLEDRGKPGGNPAHFLMRAVDNDVNEIVRTDSSWETVDVYPVDELPGESFGIVARVLIARGQSAGQSWRTNGHPIPDSWRVGFTDLLDSDGEPWESNIPWKYETRVTNVMTGLLDAAEGMGVEHIELVRYDDGGGDFGFELRAYQYYGEYPPGGVVDLPREVIHSATEMTPAPGGTDLYSKTETGWEFSGHATARAHYGVIEVGEAVGTFATPQDYNRAGKQAVLGMSARESQRIHFYDTPGLTLGVDFDLGDVIYAPVPRPDGGLTKTLVKVLTYAPSPEPSGGFGTGYNDMIRWEITTRRITFPDYLDPEPEIP